MFARLRELSHLRNEAEGAAILYRAQFLTNHGRGGFKNLAINHTLVSHYNEKRYWFMSPLEAQEKLI